MRRGSHLAFRIIGSLLALFASQALPVEAQEPAVRAVLFYSPSCPHCHKVISEDLPPLLDKYGERLQIIGVDTTRPVGQALYQAALQRYSIPEERRGVPTLIIGDAVLVGSVEIPQQLPDLVEKYLAQGGVDWPDIPGLAEALAAAQPTPGDTPVQPTPQATSAQTLLPTPLTTASPATPPTSMPALTPTPTRSVLMVTGDSPPDWRAKLARDPAGNALAIVTLLGMALVTGYVLVAWRRTDDTLATWQSWAIPLLALLGLGVAGYLAYVETQQVAAVCGPVGDCNTVQQSAYAWLFGLIPIGVLGLVGYTTILIAWAVAHCGHRQLAGLAWLALLIMTLFGTLFSMYLTFLEPFVIGATCAWCLISAIVMTALLALTARPGKRAISTLLPGRTRRAILDEGSS
ncbi:MAG: vitamin K epoxide reductase family protein [Anaerolineae bacterium]